MLLLQLHVIFFFFVLDNVPIQNPNKSLYNNKKGANLLCIILKLLKG